MSPQGIFSLCAVGLNLHPDQTQLGQNKLDPTTYYHPRYYWSLRRTPEARPDHLAEVDIAEN